MLTGLRIKSQRDPIRSIDGSIDSLTRPKVKVKAVDYPNRPV
jgi:hypothetical protein